MKKFAFLFLTLFCSVFLFAQSSSLSQLAIIHQNGNWIKMLPDSRVEADQFFTEFLTNLGLDENYHFLLIGKQSDNLGFTHSRYQEYFNGYPVEGGIYVLHAKDGLVSHANGKIIRGIPENSQLSILSDHGLNIAKESMDSQTFYWEMPGMETLIKRIKNDPNATFYPNAELVYAQAEFVNDGTQYQLAWKYELYGSNPEQKQTVFVDASSGTKLFSLEGCHSGSAEGIAETRYHGTQTIITDSVSATEFRLHDTTRGGGIETYDMNENVDDYSLAVDFIDADNYWDNANEEMDDAATDAHWGAEMTYDYFLQHHGRDSFDGNGGTMISYVHYDVDFFNAFSNGLFVSYGDGDGNPLASIDVVGHEFTHMVTDYSAELVYQDESGALNESFSDIFGTEVEFFGLGEDADWYMGNANFVLRNMSNPNEGDQPDTYNGDFWYVGTEDEGGVHTNSGVQNFWFYLLSDGGSGTNDNGDSYSVNSLGMEVAAAIAYRNLTVYLTPSSNYLDARYGAIQAAEDLYGVCSDISNEVAQAWYAVGVGPVVISQDLQVIEVLSPTFSGCELSTEEQISMAARLNVTGCDLTIDAGDELEMSYQINNQNPVIETLILSETLNAGDVLEYDFQTLADLSVSGQYFIDYTISYGGDLTASNNQINDHLVVNSKTFEGGNVLAFEDASAGDSLYVEVGSHAMAEISNLAENTGSYGFRMRSFGAAVENVTIVETDEENFEINPDFVSKMFICVDLTGWDEAYLNFDLRQTYSPDYFDFFGLELYYMIATRVMVDGIQIGEQFHPLTNNSDPYLTHVMDLSAYAGTSFVLSFEGINFNNDDETESGIGDKTLLDNIFFSQSDPTGLEDILQGSVELYPNPSSGLVNVVVDQSGVYDLRVMDLMGKVLQEQRFMSNGSPYELNLSNLSMGVYMVSIQSGDSHIVKKIVLE